MKSSLKASKYKVCHARMQRQLDASLRVTTMSMDLDLPIISAEEGRGDLLAWYGGEECGDRGAGHGDRLAREDHNGTPSVTGAGEEKRAAQQKDDEAVAEARTVVAPQVCAEEASRAAEVHGRREESGGQRRSRRSKSRSSNETGRRGSSEDPRRRAPSGSGISPGPSKASRLRSQSKDHSRIPQDMLQPSPSRQHMRVAAHSSDDKVGAHNCLPGNANERKMSNCDLAEKSNDGAQFPSASLSVMFNPNEYDTKGRCVRHSQVRLRKKKIMGGGWKVILSACPNCCVEELYRLQMHRKEGGVPSPLVDEEEGRPARDQYGDGNGGQRDNKTSSLDGSLPSSQAFTESTSSLTASTRGPSNQYSDSLRNSLRNWSSTSLSKTKEPKSETKDRCQEWQSPPLKPQCEDSVACAVKMAYVDKHDRHGVYYGQTDDQGVPHGKGVVVYQDGASKEGEWKHGRRHRRRSGSRHGDRCSGSRSRSKSRKGEQSRSSSLSKKVAKKKHPAKEKISHDEKCDKMHSVL